MVLCSGSTERFIGQKMNKKPYNLQTMTLTCVLCVVSIKKVLYKDLTFDL